MDGQEDYFDRSYDNRPLAFDGTISYLDGMWLVEVGCRMRIFKTTEQVAGWVKEELDRGLAFQRRAERRNKRAKTKAGKPVGVKKSVKATKIPSVGEKRRA